MTKKPRNAFTHGLTPVVLSVFLIGFKEKNQANKIVVETVELWVTRNGMESYPSFCM